MRGEPDAVHAEVGKVIQFFSDALEVANPVAVAIGERAWIDLIKDGGLPPFERCVVHDFIYPNLPMIFTQSCLKTSS